MKKLRPFQKEAVEKVRSLLRPNNAVLLVAPTGAGKTTMGAHMVEGVLSHGRKVLWVAHRQELVEQARSQLPPGVRVETIQGLLAMPTLPQADFVVWDEAHHYVAAQWNTVVQNYPQAFKIGLTATPERGDGKPLGDMFDSLVVAATTRQLIDAGYLVEPVVYAPPQAIEGNVIAESPVRAWFEYAKFKRTVVFAATVEHAKELVKQFERAGVFVDMVWGNMPEQQRKAVLRDFGAGHIQVLVNVQLLTEGYDLPAIEAVILARGFSHQGSYLQAVGRALRPSPGKREAIIVDLKGVTHTHGLPDADREFSLEGRTGIATAKNENVAVRQCFRCGYVWRPKGEQYCPRCNAKLPTRESPEERRQRLKKLIAAESRATRLAYFKHIHARAKAAGYKMGWVVMRFKGRYGYPPPVDFWRNV